WQPIGFLYPPRGVSLPSGRYELADQEFMLNDQQFYRAFAASSLPPASNSANGVILSDTVLSLYEGDSGTFSIHLASPPTGNVTLGAAKTSGSTNVNLLSPTILTFNATNWNTPQTYTVVADLDTNMEDSIATLVITTNQIAAATVQVLAVDSDTDDEFTGP